MTRPPRTLSDFDGRNGKFDGGDRVHSVATQPWIEGLHVPGPACHTPNGGFDPASFQPVCAEVTCRRCLRCTGVPEPVAPTVDPGQLDLLALCPNGCDGPCLCNHLDDCPCADCVDAIAAARYGLADDWECCGDPDCDGHDPADDEPEPCPVDCACAWCTPTRRVLVTTRRPDPAYL